MQTESGHQYQLARCSILALLVSIVCLGGYGVAHAKAAKVSECVARLDGDQQSLSFRAATGRRARAVTLATESTTNLLSGQSTAIHTVARGVDLILKLTIQDPGDGTIRVDVEYGRRFHGIRSALVVSDGLLVTGEVDGRAIQPFPVGDPPGAVLYQDGTPVPRVRVSKSVRKTIRRLLRTAGDELPGCANDPSVQSAQRALRPGPLDASQTCEECGAACMKAFNKCAAEAASAAVSCGFPGGIFCAVVSLAGKCGPEHSSCRADCQKEGAPCCRHRCAGGSVCCESADQCVDGNHDQSFDTCCEPGHARCGFVRCCDTSSATCIFTSLDRGPICCPIGRECGAECCSEGEACADEKSALCCPSGDTDCGGECCDTDGTQECVSDRICCSKGAVECAAGDGCCDLQNGYACISPPGRCCHADRICGGACCDELSRCVNPASEACCPFTSTDCNGVCCPGQDACIDDQCCPQSRACGSKCCPAGSRCSDPATGECEACASKEYACGTDAGSICCPLGRACCDADEGMICCGSANEACCDPPGFPPRGCYLLSECSF